MALPRISIVVPVFNSEATIARTLDSLVAQTYPELEAIFVDGGSQDRTVELAKGYGDLFSVFISEPDRGQSDAINKGFRLASGEIFNWLCGDDTYQDGALHHVAALFAANPGANMVVGASRRIYANGVEEVLPVDPNLMEVIGFRNGIDQPSAFWRSELHRAAGEIDEEMQIGMDWEWWCRLKAAGAKVATTDRELSVYYFPVTSKTSSAPEGNVQAMYSIMKRHGPFDGALADVYMRLYRDYDLKGCYDSPPSAPESLVKEWWADLAELYKTYGRDYIDAYNWTWCSRQARGLDG